jgi:hypothetical protein
MIDKPIEFSTRVIVRAPDTKLSKHHHGFGSRISRHRLARCV